jgi:hypothetical protein
LDREVHLFFSSIGARYLVAPGFNPGNKKPKAHRPMDKDEKRERIFSDGIVRMKKEIR